MIQLSPFSSACLSLVVFSLIGSFSYYKKKKCSTSGINVEGALHVLRVTLASLLQHALFGMVDTVHVLVGQSGAAEGLLGVLTVTLKDFGL